MLNTGMLFAGAGAENLAKREESLRPPEVVFHKP
jgi:hypothetical protein